jgi:hypothetical protein
MEAVMHVRRSSLRVAIASALAAGGALGTVSSAQAAVTYKPYVQPGDARGVGRSDQMVIAWQTDETSPAPGLYTVEVESDSGACGTVSPVGRVVDNYLSADPTLPVLPTATGPRVNYSALLSGLDLDTRYTYRVYGPGLPPTGFRATFRTRTRSGRFSYLVQGDEGFFPSTADGQFLVDYQARIVHLMNDAADIHFPGEPARPEPDLALNTGDNVYTYGAEGSYRDFWMPVWNSDVDSNETGAPFIRSIPFYIVVGNHDIGSTGVNVNLLATNTGGRFTGNQDGGDALVYFNNFYYPLNGPSGVDPQFTWNADTVTANGFLFQYQGLSYTSPAAIEALRASTDVATAPGRPADRQIDHMSNYSFDNGNTHFMFLDANPHLFNAILDGASVFAAAPDTFPSYPSILRKWIIDDLDASHQTWKVVVFHQPAFSSGLATLRNSQMRAIAKVLEDHGVNMVFNGHEHNYQRTKPLRALDTVASAATPSGAPAVAVDDAFDGVKHTTPDGVLYFVEGAGGNRDFDGNEGPARGSGTGLDQDDSATGTFAVSPTLTVTQGPDSWLDTHLTDSEMGAISPGAGAGEKITVKFKAKVFSFAQVVVQDDELTLYQISEPLQDVSTATPAIPAPFGTDLHGLPLKNPIPDTLLDPVTGDLVSTPAVGTPSLLDKVTLSKADLRRELSVALSGPRVLRPGAAASVEAHIANRSRHGLNGTQVVFALPEGVQYAGVESDTATVHGNEVVVTVGRLAAHDRIDVSIPVTHAGVAPLHGVAIGAVVRSSNARPVDAQ